MRARLKVPERQLQRAAADYLTLVERITGALTFSHPPNESRRGPRQGAELKAAGMRAGDPDLMIFMDGERTIFIEIKAEGGRLQRTQQDRHETLRRLGFKVYLLAASDVPDLLRQLCEILRRHQINAPQVM